MSNTDYPIKSFKTDSAWEAWLKQHAISDRGVWLRFFKKGSGKPTVSYLESVLTALCYGWIDGQVKSYDDESYIQKFTPRRAKSAWSQINKQRVAELIKSGRMQPTGLAQVEVAKANGQWENAYASPSTAKVPAEFLELLEKHPKAKQTFETLTKSNLFAIYYHLQTAKRPETKQKRMQKFIEQLEKGEKVEL